MHAHNFDTTLRPSSSPPNQNPNKVFVSFLEAALAPNSKRQYLHVWNLLLGFAALHNFSPLPLDVPQLSLFLTYLWSKQLAPSTIRSYMSVVSYFHKINGLHDHSTDFRIQKALLGISKLGVSPKQRLPVSLTLLSALINETPKTFGNTYMSHLYQAMFSLAFYALCRISEITFDSATSHTLQIQDVVHIPGGRGYRITFRTFKHSVKAQSVMLSPQTPQQYCPVYLLTAYLMKRGSAPGQLFLNADATKVSRAEFNTALRRCLLSLGISNSEIKSHSFRIGGATLAAQRGVSALTIKLLGRWRSDAYMKYITWH